VFAVSRFEYLPVISAWTEQLNAIIVRMREKASMELILIDGGLLNKAGHSYRLAKIVSDPLPRSSSLRMPPRIMRPSESAQRKNAGYFLRLSAAAACR
jgi:hypothetical protein